MSEEESSPSKSRRRLERWSTEKYYNPSIPSYVPPEIFLVKKKGISAAEAFELRANLDDAMRLNEHKLADKYFLRGKGGEVTKRRAKRSGRDDSDQHRGGTPEEMLRERHLKYLKDLSTKSKQYQVAVQVATTPPTEIIKKIRLTDEHMETKSYGAIIGARGNTHKELEKEFGCKIVLAGKGITIKKKQQNLRSVDAASLAEEPPHVRICAPNEASLQRCAQKIEWILSDHPDAVQFREENRKSLAIWNGTYDPSTWVSASAAAGNAGGGSKREGRNGGDTGGEPVDNDVEDFFNKVYS